MTSIDTASNREYALQQALTSNTDLAQFVNELLAAIHGTESTHSELTAADLPSVITAAATSAAAASAAAAAGVTAPITTLKLPFDINSMRTE